VAGLASGGRSGPAFVALAVVLPGLLLQDAWRFAFFAPAPGRRRSSTTSCGASRSSRPWWWRPGVGSVAAFVLAWGASATVAAGTAGSSPASGPAPRRAGWLREQRDLGYRYLVENVSNSGASQLRAYGLGAIAGVGAVGAVRGAELLLGPFLAC
jgi:hypothetical protein